MQSKGMVPKPDDRLLKVMQSPPFATNVGSTWHFPLASPHHDQLMVMVDWDPISLIPMRA